MKTAATEILLGQTLRSVWRGRRVQSAGRGSTTLVVSTSKARPEGPLALDAVTTQVSTDSSIGGGGRNKLQRSEEAGDAGSRSGSASGGKCAARAGRRAQKYAERNLGYLSCRDKCITCQHSRPHRSSLAEGGACNESAVSSCTRWRRKAPLPMQGDHNSFARPAAEHRLDDARESVRRRRANRAALNFPPIRRTE